MLQQQIYQEEQVPITNESTQFYSHVTQFHETSYYGYNNPLQQSNYYGNRNNNETYNSQNYNVYGKFVVPWFFLLRIFGAPLWGSLDVSWKSWGPVKGLNSDWH